MEENTKEMTNIRDLMADYENDYTDDFVQYDGYIQDAISALADSRVDIYTSDLLDWAKQNYSYIEDANREFGQVDDFLQQIRQGQYYCFEQEMYEDIENIYIFVGLYYLEDIKGEEVESDLVALVIENIGLNNDIDTFDNILDIVKNTIEEYESEEE